jgi:hypothetical protein
MRPARGKKPAAEKSLFSSEKSASSPLWSGLDARTTAPPGSKLISAD